MFPKASEKSSLCFLCSSQNLFPSKPYICVCCRIRYKLYNLCSKLRTTFFLINDGFSERIENGIVLNFVIKFQPRNYGVHGICFHVRLTPGIYVSPNGCSLAWSRPLQLAVAGKRAHAHPALLICVPLSGMTAVCTQCNSVAICTY